MRFVTRPNDEKEARSLHGLTRTLIHNMVVGVTEGFSKKLEDQRRWLRAASRAQARHEPGLLSPVTCTRPTHQDVTRPTRSSSTGIDKQKVGQFAAEVRAKRPPEPYKGKGIRYATSHSPQRRQGRRVRSN